MHHRGASNGGSRGGLRLLGEFATLGAGQLRRAPGLTVVDGHRRFRALFGASPSVCCLLWSLLCDTRPLQSKRVHMLWALMFLKVYATEHVHAALAGEDGEDLEEMAVAVC